MEKKESETQAGGAMPILDKEFVNSYKNKKVPWGFNGLGYIVYKRTYARIKEDGKLEDWHETIERCINGAQKIGAGYTKEEAERLFDLMFNLKASLAGRMLWQLGTGTVDKIGLPSLCNCWYVSIRDYKDFCFVFEHLMLGGGVGFSIKKEDVHELPKIKMDVNVVHEKTNDADFIVPDSRQGWVELLNRTLESFFVTGKSFTYSTILVRQAGEPIKTFGGKASGSKYLIDGIEKISNVLKEREGKKLRSIDALDICNIIGSVVVSGNVRRSAEIAIGDPDDFLYLRSKRWDLGGIPNWRAMSNNSIYADSFEQISKEVWDGYEGNGEPFGFINMKLARKFGRLGEPRKDNCEGVNPCQPDFAPVITKYGIRQFKDIGVGSEIWSETGWTKILKKWSTGIKPVYAYKTKAGIFYGTENHRIVQDGIKIEVKDADNIDLLTGIPYTKYELDAQAVMDGLMIGDGSIHKASAQSNRKFLCIGKNDQDYFESEIKDLIIGEHGVKKGISYKIKTNILEDELPKTYNRSIPDRYIYAAQNITASFLRGLFSANGSICGNRVTLKAASLKVIEQAQLMLNSIGIASYYTVNKATTVKHKNGNYVSKQSYDLNISTDRNKFYDLIGFIQKYKMNKLKKIIDAISIGNAKKSYEIFEVEYLGDMEVFDITVDNDPHTYWTGGLNVSNCAEATLEDKEPCDLAELFLNNIESQEELIECIKLIYKTQKAVLTLPSISKDTMAVVKRNMRIGMGVTGICQSVDKIDWLDAGYKALREFDKEWSKVRGWNESIKVTVIKPSGTLSLLAGATPGVHPSYSTYQIRRIRMSSNDDLVKLCRDAGYHIEYQRNFDKTLNYDTVVVEFPCYAGTNAIVAREMTAIKQLELVKRIQTVWADQSVSVTVYYHKTELPEIKEWMKENYATSLKTVSFLLHNEHGFDQPPYEEIDEITYNKILKQIKPIKEMSDGREWDSLEGLECEGGACPIK